MPSASLRLHGGGVAWDAVARAGGRWRTRSVSTSDSTSCIAFQFDCRFTLNDGVICVPVADVLPARSAMSFKFGPGSNDSSDSITRVVKPGPGPGNSLVRHSHGIYHGNSSLAEAWPCTIAPVSRAMAAAIASRAATDCGVVEELLHTLSLSSLS